MVVITQDESPFTTVCNVLLTVLCIVKEAANVLCQVRTQNLTLLLKLYIIFYGGQKVLVVTLRILPTCLQIKKKINVHIQLVTGACVSHAYYNVIIISLPHR